MNKKELVRAVARKSQVPMPVADDVIGALFDVLTLNLAVGEGVTVRGFGRLEARDRPSKQLTHPGTGETMEMGPYRTVVFLPSDSLKDRLNAHP